MFVVVLSVEVAVALEGEVVVSVGGKTVISVALDGETAVVSLALDWEVVISVGGEVVIIAVGTLEVDVSESGAIGRTVLLRHSLCNTSLTYQEFEAPQSCVCSRVSHGDYTPHGNVNIH
jgi:hypothetical protein